MAKQVSADRIMRKKGLIRTEMERKLPAAQCAELWAQSTAKLDTILKQYAHLPAGVHTHTDFAIFPAAAIYLTLKAAAGAQTAYSIIENAAAANTASLGEKLAKLMKIPGFAGFFIRMWDPISRKMFGESCGFQNRFYPKEKGAYRMDILACPYQKYFTELGCPELTRIFCENDERTYGNLPGVAFCRTETLGKGGKRCDFYLKKR